MTDTSAVSVIDAFRGVMSRQFEFFYEELNGAITAAGGTHHFGPGDEGRVVSYFYVLLALVGEWSKQNNPFLVTAEDRALSAPILSMGALCAQLSGKYKRNTTQRYFRDLEKMRLVVRAGRGETAAVRITMPAARAMARTIQFWVSQSLDIDAHLQNLGAGVPHGRLRRA